LYDRHLQKIELESADLLGSAMDTPKEESDSKSTKYSQSA
ncbi:16237_t:CDS:2, partial [Racocetra persica]